jgi:hypothetical protein
MKTRPGVCMAKRRYPSADQAERLAEAASITLRPYRCALCRQWHLTSRTKGMKLPAFEIARQQAARGR